MITWEFEKMGVKFKKRESIHRRVLNAVRDASYRRGKEKSVACITNIHILDQQIDDHFFIIIKVMVDLTSDMLKGKLKDYKVVMVASNRNRSPGPLFKLN